MEEFKRKNKDKGMILTKRCPKHNVYLLRGGHCIACDAVRRRRELERRAERVLVDDAMKLNFFYESVMGEDGFFFYGRKDVERLHKVIASWRRCKLTQRQMLVIFQPMGAYGSNWHFIVEDRERLKRERETF